MQSIGYEYSGMVYLQDSLIRRYINNAIKEINRIKPDYVLIDTPPSITDVHVSLIDRLNISGIIAVTQPTNLSMADVKRTIGFFSMRKIYILGIIQNMVGGELGEVVEFEGVDTVASVPMSKDYNDYNVLTSSLEPYEGVYDRLEKLEDVKLKIIRRQVLSEADEAVTLRDIESSWDHNLSEKKVLTRCVFITLGLGIISKTGSTTCHFTISFWR